VLLASVVALSGSVLASAPVRPVQRADKGSAGAEQIGGHLRNTGLIGKHAAAQTQSWWRSTTRLNRALTTIVIVRMHTHGPTLGLRRSTPPGRPHHQGNHAIAHRHITRQRFRTLAAAHPTRQPLDTIEESRDVRRL
jgi:hypothetical protein